MSAAEIADNKWEATAAKPPVATGMGVAQILMFGGLAVFFGWMLASVAYAIVGPKHGTLADSYSKMDSKEAEAAREAKAAGQ